MMGGGRARKWACGNRNKQTGQPGSVTVQSHRGDPSLISPPGGALVDYTLHKLTLSPPLLWETNFNQSLEGTDHMGTIATSLLEVAL